MNEHDAIKNNMLKIQADMDYLHNRLSYLEARQCSAPALKERIASIEHRVDASTQSLKKLTDSVEGFIIKIDETLLTFTNRVYSDFDRFKLRIDKANTAFIYWIVGSVLLSLISGLYINSKAYRDIDKSLNVFKKDFAVYVYQQKNDSLVNEVKRLFKGK